MNKKQDLSEEQKFVLHEDGTETPGSSPLNNEKREGSYHCVGCGAKLFESKTKYESGSGWPSFFQSLPDVFETKTDHLLDCTLGQNIIARIAEVIMDIFLMMAQNLQAKDTAIMVFA